ADLHDCRGVAFQLPRHVAKRAQIGGHVLAFGAVAARRTEHEPALLIAERDRESVDLRLGHELDRLRLVEPEETAHAPDELAYVVLLEGVLERKHRPRVHDLAKAFGRRGPHPERRAVLPNQLRESGLDLLVAPAERIV